MNAGQTMLEGSKPFNRDAKMTTTEKKPPAKSSVVFAVRMPLRVLRKVVAARKRLGLTKNGFIVAAAEQVADSTK